jgi:hypothetical protein
MRNHGTQSHGTLRSSSPKPIAESAEPPEEILSFGGFFMHSRADFKSNPHKISIHRVKEVIADGKT